MFIGLNEHMIAVFYIFYYMYIHIYNMIIFWTFVDSIIARLYVH